MKLEGFVDGVANRPIVKRRMCDVIVPCPLLNLEDKNSASFNYTV